MRMGGRLANQTLLDVLPPDVAFVARILEEDIDVWFHSVRMTTTPGACTTCCETAP